MNANEPNHTPLFDFQIEDLWPILRKQWRVIAIFFGFSVVGTLVFGLLRTPEYRATTLIHLSPRAGQEVAVNEVVDFNTRGYFEVQQFFRTQMQIVLSRTVREAVVERYAAMGHDDLLLEDGGAQKLLGMMTVVPEEQSQLIGISITHTDPEHAAILANLVADTYSSKNLEGRRDASAGATEWLDGQLGDYATKTEDALDAVHAFQVEHGVVASAEQLDTLAARLTALNRTYGDRSTDLVVLRTTLSGHEELLKRGAWPELARVLDSPVLDASARRLAESHAEVADLSARYGPRHPERLQAEARREAVEQTLRSEVRRILDGEKARLTVLEQEVDSLASTIEEVKAELVQQEQLRDRFDALQAELERVQGFEERLSQRLEEVRLTSRTQLNNVQIVDRALAPTAPWKPNIPMSLAISAVAGVIGGIAFALVREYIDDTITSQVDVTAHLKVPFLGLVPRLPEGLSSHEADLYTHLHPRSSVAEAVRGLRAMLEMNPEGPPPRRILVTSSVAREGKTSTTLRLGISFAQMGRRVAIVDADLRRPRLHKVFGDDHRVGLSSYLVGAAELVDILHDTPVPGLQVLYAGSSTDHPAELLGSQRMEQLLQKLEDHVDVVLVDTPPSAALSDAVTLSRRVDGILMVVKEQAVSRAVVRQTLDTLRQVDANILGVVLNNVNLDRSGSKYKYYYAYRDYYADDDGGGGGSEQAAK